MGQVPPGPQTVSVNEAEKLNVKVVVFLIEHVHQLFEYPATTPSALIPTTKEIPDQGLTVVKDENERLMALYYVTASDWAAKRFEQQLKEMNAVSVSKAELTTRDWAIILTGTVLREIY